MITVLRLHWTSLDDDRWSVLRSVLTTASLASHGCLSWHSRRDRDGVRVTALWDHGHAATRFAQGHLLDVLRAVDVEQPVASQAPVSGLHFSGRRPVLAAAA